MPAGAQKPPEKGGQSQCVSRPGGRAASSSCCVSHCGTSPLGAVSKLAKFIGTPALACAEAPSTPSQSLAPGAASAGVGRIKGQLQGSLG